MFKLFKKNKKSQLSNMDIKALMHDDTAGKKYFEENCKDFSDFDKIEKMYKNEEDIFLHTVENEVCIAFASLYGLAVRTYVFHEQIENLYGMPDVPIEEMNKEKNLYGKIMFLIKKLRPYMTKELWMKVYDPTFDIVIAFVDVALERNKELERRYGDKLYEEIDEYYGEKCDRKNVETAAEWFSIEVNFTPGETAYSKEEIEKFRNTPYLYWMFVANLIYAISDETMSISVKDFIVQ